MEKRQIANIINFVRACEPREALDLTEPVKRQLTLLRRYNLPGTFLLQYDALIDPSFSGLFENAGENIELGVWLEVVEPLVLAAGIPWRGRYPWDWHANVGFTVGYTPEERIRLVDTLFEGFKSVFGYYPKSLGSWTIDAVALNRAAQKYGIDASCNCKEQWGTDGYTLWGSFWDGGYYPSVKNSFMPAQTVINQIPVPVFRMLGSDPVHQYDAGLDINSGASENQGVITLEPAYKHGGGDPAWIDRYFAEKFDGRCLAYSYVQSGQENSFGWKKMERGLTHQFARLAELRASGKISVETLGDTGRWYKHAFPLTPPAAVTVTRDEENSVWYNCKNYRANLYTENCGFFFRDIYLFNENYAERYLNAVCTDKALKYDCLPFTDGNRFSRSGVRAGLFPELCGKALTYKSISYAEESGSAIVTFAGTEAGDVRITLSERAIALSAKSDFSLSLRYGDGASIPEMLVKQNKIELSWEGFKYSVTVSKGQLSGENHPRITSDKRKIELTLG